ncbi:peroxiredoxin [Vitiosangium sp. GDMCC 1.1324]|uniref:peroxiredoxin family protein n=1 Tax=Vitiosangium sp. (strain GDMCC 1.1324) TaxID=2138576 RepID=UPI000D360D30|nr:TlpA disulfide reductase family protein [Vitiosangium sp. GDMCC 1.1324]PTL80951.1 TlpA family protein disulfide reductase [Vitiosangium sp. GDMCC 1.1324]
MRRAALAVGCALVLALAGCRRVPEEPERAAGPSPYLRSLLLPSVGPTPYDWRRLPGRVVMVSFFATWCFPCLAELPTLEALQKEFGPQGFQVVLVGLDLDGTRVLEPFAEQYALNFPVLVSDTAMQQGQSAFGLIPALPATFLLDKEGQVAGAWQGMAGHKDVSQAVEKLLRR